MSASVLPGMPSSPGRWHEGLRYGALGLPLAFVALPLYVLLPNHYASELGLPLAAVGALLLAARLVDALADPWIGRRCDHWFAHSPRRVVTAAAIAAVVLAIGFRALFVPPRLDTPTLWIWCAVSLVVTYLAYSVLGVLHQSWGARLGGAERQRASVVAWREAAGLVGVLVATVLPALVGLPAMTVVFAGVLAGGVWLLAQAPRPPVQAAARADPLTVPLRTPAFRRLLAVYLVNGVASAVPATLVLFYVRDRLQAPAWEPAFLALYFAAGALSMPLWVRAVGRLGLERAWLAGMALSVAAFVWAALLGAGDVAAFAAVCAASGLALGADLALPGALLAGVIQQAGHRGRHDGAYFGWWNLATKLNLALAAGVALPLLQAFGYQPGTRDEAALQTLTLAYAALPCALKLAAAALLVATIPATRALPEVR